MTFHPWSGPWRWFAIHFCWFAAKKKIHECKRIGQYFHSNCKFCRCLSYSIALRYRQKKSGRIRYLYSNNSHSFSRSASAFDILCAFGMLNGPSGSPWNSGMLLKKSQVCLKLSGVSVRCRSLRSVLHVGEVILPKLMPKNPLQSVCIDRFVGVAVADAVAVFLPFGKPSKCEIFGQKLASLKIRLSAINGEVVKVFSPWYCSYVWSGNNNIVACLPTFCNQSKREKPSIN